MAEQLLSNASQKLNTAESTEKSYTPRFNPFNNNVKNNNERDSQCLHTNEKLTNNMRINSSNKLGENKNNKLSTAQISSPDEYRALPRHLSGQIYKHPLRTNLCSNDELNLNDHDKSIFKVVDNISVLKIDNLASSSTSIFKSSENSALPKYNGLVNATTVPIDDNVDTCYNADNKEMNNIRNLPENRSNSETLILYETSKRFSDRINLITSASEASLNATNSSPSSPLVNARELKTNACSPSANGISNVTCSDSNSSADVRLLPSQANNGSVINKSINLIDRVTIFAPNNNDTKCQSQNPTSNSVTAKPEVIAPILPPKNKSVAKDYQETSLGDTFREVIC